MGANNLIVLPGTAASGGVSFGAGSVLTLTAEDSEAILRENFPMELLVVTLLANNL